jgi:hypothetical protein
MVRAPELYTPLSIFDVMMRSDNEAIVARNTCDFYGGKYCITVKSPHSTCRHAVQRSDNAAILASIEITCVLGENYFIVASRHIIVTLFLFLK